MERTHCGLYQAAATDDCKDIVTSGKLLKLIRVFHGVSQSTLAGRTGYFSEALSLVYRRLAEKKEEELLPAGGRLFCCFTL